MGLLDDFLARAAVAGVASALAAGNVADLMDGRQKISQLRLRLGPGLSAGGAAWAAAAARSPRDSSASLKTKRSTD